MLLADVAPDHVTFWWITLGIGLVVAVVVVVLLSMLVALVDDIDRNVADAWETATKVARNTATTWMLSQTATASGELRQEIARHAELVGAKGAPR